MARRKTWPRKSEAADDTCLPSEPQMFPAAPRTSSGWTQDPGTVLPTFSVSILLRLMFGGTSSETHPYADRFPW